MTFIQDAGIVLHSYTATLHSVSFCLHDLSEVESPQVIKSVTLFLLLLLPSPKMKQIWRGDGVMVCVGWVFLYFLDIIHIEFLKVCRGVEKKYS